MLQEVAGKYLPSVDGEIIDGGVSVSDCTASCYNAVTAAVIDWRLRRGYNWELNNQLLHLKLELALGGKEGEVTSEDDCATITTSCLRLPTR